MLMCVGASCSYAYMCIRRQMLLSFFFLSLHNLSMAGPPEKMIFLLALLNGVCEAHNGQVLIRDIASWSHTPTSAHPPAAPPFSWSKWCLTLLCTASTQRSMSILGMQRKKSRTGTLCANNHHVSVTEGIEFDKAILVIAIAGLGWWFLQMILWQSGGPQNVWLC